jgi:putative transcriptional regulator
MHIPTESELLKGVRAMKDISEMVKKKRIGLGLTQEQFAAKIGVTFSTVNRWENNKARPSPLALHRINELQRSKKIG